MQIVCIYIILLDIEKVKNF